MFLYPAALTHCLQGPWFYPSPTSGDKKRALGVLGLVLGPERQMGAEECGKFQTRKQAENKPKPWSPGSGQGTLPQNVQGRGWTA